LAATVDEGASVRLQVKGKNVEVNEQLKRYAVDKLARLDKHLNEATRLELELAVEKNPSIAAKHVAEATVWTKGPVLRAREASHDMRSCIDLLVDKLERQAKRYHDRRRRHSHRGDHGTAAAVPRPVVPEADEPLIVKTKQFPVKPMAAEEAVLQLELIGHDFFVFQNVETDTVNVVYRRRDGNYGLIEPQAS
jgi:putative sigma-54 modulation protein